MAGKPGRWLGLGLCGVLWACGEKATESVPVDGPPQVRAEALGMHVVRIAWSTALAEGAVGFDLERRVGLQGGFEVLERVAPQGGDSVIYLDTDVEPEMMYGYRVRGVGPTGEQSDPSVVAGVLTPSRPGIVTDVTTTLPSNTAGDPDGYVVRITGPDTASAVISSTGGAASVTFKPLMPGEYAVRFNGIAAQCRASDSLRMVTVTDSGVNTLARANFQVDCRDPTRGDVFVRADVTRGDNGAPLTLRFVGQADDATLPDAERIVFRETTLGATGGSFTFDRIRPGTYETELRALSSACTLTGTAVRPIQVAALDADTVVYAVRCGSGAGGDFHPANPAKPYKLRYRFVPAQASVGQAVTLIASADLSAGTPIQFSSVQALSTFDATALRFDGATFTTPYSGFANAPSGNVAWLATSTSGPAAQVVEVARFQFTVVGGAGEDVVTSTTLDIFDDLQGNTFVDQAEVLLEAPLLILGGGGGNQSPVAAIGGGATLSATVGVPLSLSGAGSSDPDGSITGYAWNLTGGAPPSATGATTSTTYAAAGTYTVQLTVTDDDGATASASKQVNVTSGGGGNQAPTAVIAGAATLGGVAGQAVSLSAAGSTDPDGSIVSYAWTLSGALPPTASGSNPSATWNTAGTYTIQLTVTDNLGATGSASKQIIISPVSSDAAVLRLAFGTAQPDGRVPLTLTLQFLADIPETAGPELLKSFRIDSVTWNGARLALDAVTNPSNVNLSTVTNPARPGWIQLSGTIVGSGAGGTVPLATLMLRPVAASSGSTTTVSGASQLIAPTTLGSFNYSSRTRVEEATYP